MAVTPAQIQALSDSSAFQNRVRGAIYQKAAAILDDFKANGNLNYDSSQVSLAQNICKGNINPNIYVGALSGSSNISVTNITYDFVTRQVITDILDADLASQIFTTVFTELKSV